MARVVVTRPADADVANIVVYLAERAGYAVATRYVATFDALYDRLADFPAIGPPRTSLGSNARIAFVHPFVVIYDLADDTVTILRVLHGKRNITADLLRR